MAGALGGEPAREEGRSFEGIVLDPSTPGERLALVGARTRATWADLRSLAGSLERDCATLAGRRVGVLLGARPVPLAALAALDRLSCDVFLMDAGLDRDRAARLGAELRLAAILAEAESGRGPLLEQVPLSGELAGSGRSSVTLLTSGTGGRPKAARHSWRSLGRPVRANGGAPRWLLAYRPHLYAGLQVLLQCLGNAGTLVAPDPDTGPPAIGELMRSAGVECASATPSYWRRLLQFADPDVLRAVRLAQITLGGEVVDQHILDALTRTFPSARIVHVYATTEHGRCFSVGDGKAGFPARYLLEPTPDGVELAIEDGELVVCSPNAMQGYDGAADGGARPPGGHRPTGDFVEVVGERVFFVGRRTDVINVGGNKVHPLEVERVLRGVPGVADVRVLGKRSSIAGELVACQVVAAGGAGEDELRQRIATACAAELTAFQRPRTVEVVAEIPLERSGKTNRRAES